jgi:ribonucleoside-diphosphate reductase alpha chain
VLRGEGEGLSSGGASSGPLSFLRIYDTVAAAIKSGGKTRRAARMTTMRYHHPDILKFIESKVREDEKARILIEAGIPGGMDGEATTTVAFQNTNISVRLDDYFFEQVEKDGNVDLINVNDGKVVDSVSARRMLKGLSFGSWRVGDPAVQYETIIQEMHTSKNSGRINSSNPCSEYMYLDDSSCNLGSHNLIAYSNENGNFNFKDFMKASKLTAIAADILNDAASYPFREIAEISPEFRTIGIGYANLGALLMRKGLAYDSDKGRALAAAITALMTGSVYEASTEMAEKLGTFTHFEFNREPMLEVIRKHTSNLEKIALEGIEVDIIKKEASRIWDRVIERGEKYGFRNAQATVLAPTGTISYLMNCDTTGVEPGTSLIIRKNLAGGGNLTLVNKEIPNALKNLGYDETQIKEIEKYIAEEIELGIFRNHVIDAPHLKRKHYDIFATAFGNIYGEGSIPFEGHIKMLGATQPFISGAISKTNNLPETATVKDIYDGFILGHELGLKALAAFRYNSKATSALDFRDLNHKKFGRGEKEDLPSEGESFRQEVKISGTPFLINIGEYEDGRPAEVVVNSYTADSTMGNVLRVAGIGASNALKRGVPLEDVVKGWIGHGFEPKGFVTTDTPVGPHPLIKQAHSPLDFVGRLLLIHYKGMVDHATEPENVNPEKLRGFKNGAFLYYAREGINAWKVDQVLEDPLFGGFVEGDDLLSSILKQSKSKRHRFSDRAVNCGDCGNIMEQYAPNCFKCLNCGERTGGCGM